MIWKLIINKSSGLSWSGDRFALSSLHLISWDFSCAENMLRAISHGDTSSATFLEFAESAEKGVGIMDSALKEKVLFLTGATGMLGTALVVRVILDIEIAHLYVLVRGGPGTLINSCIMDVN